MAKSRHSKYAQRFNQPAKPLRLVELPKTEELIIEEVANPIEEAVTDIAFVEVPVHASVEPEPVIESSKESELTPEPLEFPPALLDSLHVPVPTPVSVPAPTRPQMPQQSASHVINSILSTMLSREYERLYRQLLDIKSQLENYNVHPTIPEVPNIDIEDASIGEKQF